ncbi:Transcriptional regulator [Frankia sp. AiPs1]|uniref:MarR family winged helix-turn-helix transcriptional regulator n=1 Tax=Frankia sp. AiPa1 TaxID=573492 RepID=UPI00202B0D2D|nr:MarR family transcriptional regulator [Frankia sp. AiPa1]MCL9761293.1 MarR family transcriptional regulator [Frankia sp. AiPa1]
MRSQDAGLAEALVDLSHHVLHLFADAGRGHGLSQQQVELLCAVIVRGAVGMTELGRLLHVEKPNLSNLTDRLERRGLVVRSRAAHDRRATEVTLTDEGTAVAMRTYRDVAARVRTLLERVPQAEQQQLATVARRIVHDEPA